ncbi:MAG: nickel pincer cofactor biosynthesis protein LarC, partial [Fibrobacter sp.]|nr:nickel pincer cofactor biosynthesis protein LarC [Fibrobacter sp.]
MRTLYFNLLCGASGDMLLSSLIDIGFPVEYLNEQIAKLNIEKVSVTADRVMRKGISCMHLDPQFEQVSGYRHLGDILKVISNAKISESVKTNCEKVFTRLAQAEADVHGTTIDKVHFHEIGALDTILDIFGFCTALDYFQIDEVQFSTLTVGHGFTTAAHGVMPLPVPATTKLITGFNVETLDINFELLTPTGAAILTTLGKQTDVPQKGKLLASGYGCGNRDLEHRANVIRSFLVESCTEGAKTDTICLIETDTDHISGEIMGHAAKIFLEKGALDVSWTPLFMKKGRPGYRLTVMVSEENCENLIDSVLIETRTLGVRVQRVNRVMYERSCGVKELDGEQVKEKKCMYKGHSFSKLE